MKKITFTTFLTLVTSLAFSQAGISVSPGRVYYNQGAGISKTQSVSLANPTDKELEIGVSFSDWDYEVSGNNNIVQAGTLNTSCVSWLQVLPASYIILKPGETKEIQIVMKVPQETDKSVPVHTGMIFFTQLNPGKSTDQNGASIQVTVRMGVKIYHSFEQKAEAEVEFADFTSYADESDNKILELKIENTGTIWADGIVKWELFNNSTGKKTILKEAEFYTLPGNIRALKQILPADLPSGNYTASAILTYGEKDVIKIAEIEFGL